MLKTIKCILWMLDIWLNMFMRVVTFGETQVEVNKCTYTIRQIDRKIDEWIEIDGEIRLIDLYLDAISCFCKNLWCDVSWSAADGEQRLPHGDRQTEVGQLQGLGVLGTQAVSFNNPSLNQCAWLNQLRYMFSYLWKQKVQKVGKSSFILI